LIFNCFHLWSVSSLEYENVSLCFLQVHWVSFKQLFKFSMWEFSHTDYCWVSSRTFLWVGSWFPERAWHLLACSVTWALKDKAFIPFP
jgi:hypothetical protein